ncbi:uncharacterized protein LOC120326930 [Styela clava]
MTERNECGYPGIPMDSCVGRGCCYDNSTAETIWCYKASQDLGLTKTALILLATDKEVPKEVLRSLFADSVPGAEWLLAFNNGTLNTKRLLQIIAKRNRVSIDPFLGELLSGKSALQAYLEKIADETGLDTTPLSLLIRGNSRSILNHLVALAWVKSGKTNIISLEIMNILLSKNPNPGAYMIQHFVEILMPYSSKNNPFRDAFFRALKSRKPREAIYWAYLVSIYDEYPQDSFYPPNTGHFVNLIDTIKKGMVPRSILNRAGLDTEFNKGKNFTEVFGKPAKVYVCQQHPEYLRVSCQNLKGKFIVTDKDCLNAGCCITLIVAENRKICYENYLGNIGLKLAFSNETTTDLKQFFKFAARNFIPWVPNTALPPAFVKFQSSPSVDPFNQFYPTLVPIEPHPVFRPNFTWKPHGPTAFPFPTRLPKQLQAPTDMSLIEFGKPSKRPPLFIALPPKCIKVPNEDRYPCIDNYDALARGGKDKCIAMGCCYTPDWSNFTVTACFRKIKYGQCYKVEESEREECGYPGINKTECLKNTQCCFNSAVTAKGAYNKVPWCFYKKRSPVIEPNNCAARPILPKNRVGCFLNHNFNHIVSRQSCEAVKGCCYEEVEPTWFERVVLGKVKPPTCYKNRRTDTTPTDFPPRE